jgi:hypothetical protein
MQRPPRSHLLWLSKGLDRASPHPERQSPRRAADTGSVPLSLPRNTVSLIQLLPNLKQVDSCAGRSQPTSHAVKPRFKQLSCRAPSARFQQSKELARWPARPHSSSADAAPCSAPSTVFACWGRQMGQAAAGYRCQPAPPASCVADHLQHRYSPGTGKRAQLSASAASPSHNAQERSQIARLSTKVSACTSPWLVQVASDVLVAARAARRAAAACHQRTRRSTRSSG